MANVQEFKHYIKGMAVKPDVVKEHGVNQLCVASITRTANQAGKVQCLLGGGGTKCGKKGGIDLIHTAAIFL